MGAVKLFECDNCEDATFKKDQPHYAVRGVNKTDKKVGKLVLCVGCGEELFGDKIKEAKPRKAKETAAPVKATTAKQTQAKAS